jgi:putative resolvase
MKSGEVLKTLRISRGTLHNYVKQGLIKTKPLPHGRFDYDKESVYSIINTEKRKTIIYARVSTPKQKKDLENQIELIKKYCFSKGIQVDSVYQDVASGINFEKRKDFFKLLDLVVENKVERIIITYKDRLSRVGFELFSYLFKNFGCEIEVISEVGSLKLDSQEVFEEIVSLLHCYSMKLYSKRKVNKIKSVLSEKD